jgi:hypothetical protein
MKGNERKNAFISFHFFFGIVTFQKVTADSNKKFPPGPGPLEMSHALLWSDAAKARVPM